MDASTRERRSLKTLYKGFLTPIAAALMGLSAFSVAQPLFDVLRRSPEFFVIRGLQAPGILLLVLGATLLPPLVLLLTWFVFSKLHPPSQATISACVLITASFPLFLMALKRCSWLPSFVVMAGSLVGAAAVAWCFHKWKIARQFLTYCGIAGLAVPVLFLSSPAIASLLTSTSQAAFIDAEVGSPVPVFVLIFDELSLASLITENQEIDNNLFPNFARLAHKGTWYPRAVTVSEATHYAVPAILTGNNPVPGRLPNISGHQVNLFTILAGGYSIRAAEPITRLCPPEVNLLHRAPEESAVDAIGLIEDLTIVYLHIILPEGMTSSLPEVTQTWGHFTAGDSGKFGPETPDPSVPSKVTSESSEPTMSAFNNRALLAVKSDRVAGFTSFLSQISTEQNALYVCHLMFPHLPWKHIPDGRTYSPPFHGTPGLRSAGKQWSQDSRFSTLAAEQYLVQLAFTDALLGDFLDRLVDLEIFDKSLIVLVADHGVSFRPGDSRRFLTLTNSGDILPVPLIIKFPNQKTGKLDVRDVSTLDIVPTILGTLEVESSLTFDGGDLTSESFPGSGRSVVIPWSGDGPFAVSAQIFNQRQESTRRFAGIIGDSALGDRVATDKLITATRGENTAGLHVNTEMTWSMELTDLVRPEPQLHQNTPSFAVISGRVSTPGRDRGDPLYAVVVVDEVARDVAQCFPLEDDLSGFLIFSKNLHLGPDSPNPEVFLLTASEPRMLKRAGPDPIPVNDEETGLDTSRALLNIGEKRFRISRAAARGRLDRWAEVGSGAILTGWAADRENSKPPNSVVLTCEDKIIGIFAIDVFRKDVTDPRRLLSSAPLGFNAYLREGAPAPCRQKGIRAFAIFDASRTASEIMPVYSVSHNTRRGSVIRGSNGSNWTQEQMLQNDRVTFSSTEFGDRIQARLVFSCPREAIPLEFLIFEREKFLVSRNADFAPGLSSNMTSDKPAEESIVTFPLPNTKWWSGATAEIRIFVLFQNGKFDEFTNENT